MYGNKMIAIVLASNLRFIEGKKYFRMPSVAMSGVRVAWEGRESETASLATGYKFQGGGDRPKGRGEGRKVD